MRYMTYDQAISFFGSAANLARAVGINRASIAGWKKNGIPTGRQFQIQHLTGGELVPDFLTAGTPVSPANSSDSP